MSDRFQDPTRGCAGKWRYGYKQVLKVKQRILETRGEQLEAYQCWICKRWHLGHRPKGT